MILWQECKNVMERWDWKQGQLEDYQKEKDPLRLEQWTFQGAWIKDTKQVDSRQLLNDKTGICMTPYDSFSVLTNSVDNANCHQNRVRED